MKTGIPKMGKMRQSGGFPSSGGYLFNFVAMNLKCNSSAEFIFPPNKYSQVGFTRKMGQWEGISEVRVLIRE